MSIPAAVLKQAERSDEILSRLRTETQPPVQPPAPAQPPAETPPAEVPPVAAAPVTPDPAAPSEPEARRVDWKHKYLVLEGKYRAEVPAFAAELRQVKAKLNDVTGKLIEAQDELLKFRSGAVGQAVTEDSLDPTLAAAIDQRVAKATQKVVGDRIAPIEARHQDDEQARAVGERVKFEDDVTDILRDSHRIDWREVDTLPAFHTFLSGRDPYTGLERRQLLHSAVAASDPVRAALFFQDFLNTQKPSPAPQAPPAPARDPREALVTPPRATAGAPITQPEKTYYTKADITRFYADYAKRQVDRRTPSSEMARLQQIDLDIQAAMREGRIR